MTINREESLTEWIRVNMTLQSEWHGNMKIHHKLVRSIHLVDKGQHDFTVRMAW